MFLIVFVSLVISIIGLYAQVLTLQTAKMNQSITGLMQTMITWHGTAVALAKTLPTADYNGMTGCRLTKTVSPTPTPPAYCGGVFVTALQLPTGYNITKPTGTSGYSFYSIAYQLSSTPFTSYVITFVENTDASGNSMAATGNIMLPDKSGFTTGTTAGDLMRQLTRNAPPYLLFGTVSGGNLVTLQRASGDTTGPPTSTSYPIPNAVPSGSIAIISAAQ